MFFFRKKKKRPVRLVSPITGSFRPLKEVPDPVFSGKLMGEGFAVEPEEGRVVAPEEGEVIHLFPTRHALGLLTPSGLRIILHVGIDTVEMNGEGFTAHVAQGDRVRAGQTLLTFDLQKVRERAKSPVSPVVFSNVKEGWTLRMLGEGSLKAGETVVVEVEKK